MNDTDARHILLEIINQAQEGNSLQFQYIRSWQEFKFRWRQAKSTKVVIKTLQVSADNLFNEYCKDVITGISDVTKLFAYSELQAIIAFYENDLITLQEMLDDYDDYLGKGNFWYSFLGGERETWNIL